jgi:hypothetical protein
MRKQEVVMEELLLELLNTLEEVGQSHEEIADTESREAMRRAVFKGFLKPEPSFSLPTDFGLDDDNANHVVGQALGKYIQAANAKATELGLDFHGRLRAFQNPNVQTSSGTTYDEFFGYASPDWWSESGEWLGRK